MKHHWVKQEWPQSKHQDLVLKRGWGWEAAGSNMTNICCADGCEPWDSRWSFTLLVPLTLTWTQAFADLQQCFVCQEWKNVTIYGDIFFQDGLRHQTVAHLLSSTRVWPPDSSHIWPAKFPRFLSTHFSRQREAPRDLCRSSHWQKPAMLKSQRDSVWNKCNRLSTKCKMVTFCFSGRA